MMRPAAAAASAAGCRRGAGAPAAPVSPLPPVVATGGWGAGGGSGGGRAHARAPLGRAAALRPCPSAREVGCLFCVFFSPRPPARRPDGGRGSDTPAASGLRSTAVLDGCGAGVTAAAGYSAGAARGCVLEPPPAWPPPPCWSVRTTCWGQPGRAAVTRLRVLNKQFQAIESLACHAAMTAVSGSWTLVWRPPTGARARAPAKRRAPCGRRGALPASRASARRP